MGKTNIEWADKVWNPETGCTKVSDGCANCYAERMSKRLRGRYGYDADDPFRVTLHLDRLDEPLKMKKPKRIFVCSMGDLFHKDVPRDFIWKVLKTAYMGYINHGHIFLFLTKRPEKMKDEVFLWAHLGGLNMSKLYGMHFGVSVEDQAAADERIPLLLQTPAAKRFVSIEPMLGPVDLNRISWNLPPIHKGDISPAFMRCSVLGNNDERHITPRASRENRLDGVILGGETGPGARPMHPDWARKVRDDCKAAGVSFFFKQWGEWAVTDWDKAVVPNYGYVSPDGGRLPSPGNGFCYSRQKLEELGCVNMERVGKKAAGHLLDGVEHREIAE